MPKKFNHVYVHAFHLNVHFFTEENCEFLWEGQYSSHHSASLKAQFSQELV